MMWTCRKSSGPGRRSCRLPKGTGSWHGTFSIPSGRMPSNYTEAWGVLLAAGVFHYQPTDLMGALLPFLSGRFPGGTLFFDAVSSPRHAHDNAMSLARSGNRNAPMTFASTRSRPWPPCPPVFAAVSETPFHGLPLNGLTLSTRVNIAIVQLFGMLKYVTIRFREFL